VSQSKREKGTHVEQDRLEVGVGHRVKSIRVGVSRTCLHPPMYSNPNYGGGGSIHHSSSVTSRRGYTPSYANQSGYSYSPGPPQGADPQLWQWFTAVDTDRSGSISVNELQAALVNGQPPFLFRSCNSHILPCHRKLVA
jgi:hypothetical protein